MTGARPQVGLILSCGEQGGDHPRKLDYIRPKPGANGQYAAAADRFTAVYGARPRQVDVVFVTDVLGDVLDVRPKLWGTSGIRAVGVRNLADTDDPAVFQAAIDGFDWELTTFPDDKPAPDTYTLTKGRADPVVRAGLKVYATLRVTIPDVTGLMMLAEISTTSRRSMTNWHEGLRLARQLTGGVLVGIPFKLTLRGAHGRYFDAKQGKRRTTTFYEWTLDSAHTVAELYAIAADRRAAITGGTAPVLALPPVRHDDADRDEEVTPALWRPAEVTGDTPSDVDVQLFDEQAGEGAAFLDLAARQMEIARERAAAVEDVGEGEIIDDDNTDGR